MRSYPETYLILGSKKNAVWTRAVNLREGSLGILLFKLGEGNVKELPAQKFAKLCHKYYCDSFNRHKLFLGDY